MAGAKASEAQERGEIFRTLNALYCQHSVQNIYEQCLNCLRPSVIEKPVALAGRGILVPERIRW